MEFGKLQYLDLREAWLNEATDFTPWLAENIQVLGDVLGLQLELKEREASVGSFSCDLHAVDLASGRTVIIENQLEATDHSHLGQLLTYAAGLEAAVVVWVAREIRDEHRAALDWLNRKTAADTHFFAVVPRVFRIDESRPTYELQLIVSPNEWGQSVILDDTPDPDSKSQRYKRFFQSLIDAARSKGFRGLRNALPQNWMRFTTGKSDIGCYVSFTSTKKLRVELYFESSTAEVNKARFDAVVKNRGEIERSLGTDMNWERLDEKKGARIAIYRDAAIDGQPEELESLSVWALGTLLLLRDKLFPQVQAIIDQVE
jgi:hypothetical protein